MANDQSKKTFTKQETPEGFDIISINQPDGGPWIHAEWAKANQLKRAELESVIAAKQRRLPNYRTNLPGQPIWLFIHVSITPSRTVALPHEASGWTLESSFDKIILFNYPEREVFEF